MRKKMRTAWPLLIMLCCVGCVAPEDDNILLLEQDKIRLTKRVDELKARIATMEGENAMLQSRITELRLREGSLAERINNLKFLVEQQDKQIGVLADAPKQRDRYKAEVEEFKRVVNELRKTISELKQRLASPPATSPTDQ